MWRQTLAAGVLCIAIWAVAACAAGQSSHDANPAASKAMSALPALDAHPVVALTVDDLPAAGSLPTGQSRTKIASALVAELLSNGLAGTFGFVNAVKLENDPDAQQALKTWLDAGMNIGSHTWSHMSLTDNTADAFESDIAQNEPALWLVAEKSAKRHGFTFDAGCESDFRAFISPGAAALEMSHGATESIDQAKRDVERLVLTMMNDPELATSPNPKVLHEWTLLNARLKFCPCYPFC